MLRKMITLLAALAAAVFLWGAPVYAAGAYTAGYNEEFDYGREALEGAVPPEAADILDDADITPDNGGALSLTFEGVLAFIWEEFCSVAAKPFRLLAALTGIVLLSALSRSAAETAEGKLNSVFTTVGVLAGAGMSIAAVSDILTDTMNLLSAAAAFMLAFIPIFAGVLAVMGRTATASAANAVTLAATQLFSQLAVNFLVPLCGTVMGLSITGAIHPELNISRLGELIRKSVIWTLSLLMTVFMSILSAQTFVTNAADNVFIKTAKFAVSSGVPIVGGTISDAVNTLHGSMSILHSSIGTYGIIAAVLIILPTLLSVICYRFVLLAAETLGEIFGIKELAALFKSFGSVMSIIIAVIVCFLLMNTIAAIIMLAAGNGSA